MDNSNNNNEYNIQLYNSVFNNVYLKRIILNHLTIYNIFYNNIRFTSQKQWEEFKYRDYLNNITLYFEYEDLAQLPENIKHVHFLKTNSELNNLKSISNHIESIKIFAMSGCLEFESDLLNINLTVLSKIIGLGIELIDNDQLELNKLLPSVTNLNFINCKVINLLLKKEMIPSNLKSIYLQNVNSIENGCSLESLSNVSLTLCPPSIINQILSNNLVKLEFTGGNGSNNNIFDSGIIFPESLQELTISCYSFNAKLPSKLKSLYLKVNFLKDTIIFPSSLEQISVLTMYNQKKKIFNNRESVPCNLKSLEFQCSSIVDNNGESILPDKLEKLLFFTYCTQFNKVLKFNQLPSSLTFLDLGEYDKIIDINVLPSSLRTLKLGEYTRIINPLAIPQQLELLKINNSKYNHPINLPVSTHPNLIIECNNLNLYYNPSNKSIRKLKLPRDFKSPLSELQLQDKSSLEYLHLGYRFNQSIELSDLPTNNNIKTLELSDNFNQTINLDYFQNLETIILPQYSKPTITTGQQDIIYNNYKLKNIIVPSNNTQFILNLNTNFYQFIKLKK